MIVLLCPFSIGRWSSYLARSFLLAALRLTVQRLILLGRDLITNDKGRAWFWARLWSCSLIQFAVVGLCLVLLRHSRSAGPSLPEHALAHSVELSLRVIGHW